MYGHFDIKRQLLIALGRDPGPETSRVPCACGRDVVISDGRCGYCAADEAERLTEAAKALGKCLVCLVAPATTADGERCESCDVCPTCEMSRSEPHCEEASRG